MKYYLLIIIYLITIGLFCQSDIEQLRDTITEKKAKLQSLILSQKDAKKIINELTNFFDQYEAQKTCEMKKIEQQIVNLKTKACEKQFVSTEGKKLNAQLKSIQAEYKNVGHKVGKRKDELNSLLTEYSNLEEKLNQSTTDTEKQKYQLKINEFEKKINNLQNKIDLVEGNIRERFNEAFMAVQNLSKDEDQKIQDLERRYKELEKKFKIGHAMSEEQSKVMNEKLYEFANQLKKILNPISDQILKLTEEIEKISDETYKKDPCSQFSRELLAQKMHINTFDAIPQLMQDKFIF